MPEHIDLLIEARWIAPVAPDTLLTQHAVAIRHGRIDLFRKLQGVGALRVRVDKDRTRGRMATVVFATRTATPEIAQWQRELRTLLGLDPAATSYALVYGAEAENNREIDRTGEANVRPGCRSLCSRRRPESYLHCFFRLER